MKTARLLVIALLAGGLAACNGARPVSPDTHEAPRATLFPHEKHGGFDCVDCHTGIPKATRLGEAKLPTAVKCEECHEIQKPSDDATRKAAAAAAAVAKRQPREYALTFNHVEHLKRIKTKELNQTCTTCHKELLEPGPARNVTPPMQACTTCHYHSQEVAEAKCQPCHLSLKRYALTPIEALAGFSHQGNWIREHQNLSKNSAATCAQCHDQTYCARCHATATVPFRTEIQFPEQVQSGFIHRGDYVSRHQIEANADPASCRKCHGSFFCDSCHKEQNISPRVSIAGGTPRNPHPPGWAFPGSGQFHGTAARNNIVSCAGCHDQGPAAICVTCHRSVNGVPGIGGDPHPPDFRSKHKREDIAKNGMCGACHTGP